MLPLETRERAAWPAPRTLFLIAGPTLALALFAYLSNQSFAIRFTSALTVWMALWWLSECIDAAITALLPLALLPLVGVLKPIQVAQAYGHELILLLAGGFMLSGALEASGAHRRLALRMLQLCGGNSGRNLIWGFAFATGLLSMWISNTASTLMMLPVAIAILASYPEPKLRAPLILAIAYAASLGGMGTPMGTPPNLVFMQAYEQSTGTKFSFFQWLQIGIPLVLITLPILACWLGRGLKDTPAAILPECGSMRPVEKRVLIVFGLIACAWIFRAEPFGGWSQALGMPLANDASVALIGVVVLCLLPNGDGNGEFCLDWQRAQAIPWGALMVFAGGIALASGFEQSGLSTVLATQLNALTALPLPVMLLGLCLGVTIMSEIASNTATAVLLMPVLAVVAKSQNIDPALIMLPAALAASLGFMLPVATAPNAIAYGSGMVSNRQMLRAGWFLDLAGVLVLALISWLVFA